MLFRYCQSVKNPQSLESFSKDVNPSHGQVFHRVNEDSSCLMGRDQHDDRRRALVLGKFKFLYQVTVIIRVDCFMLSLLRMTLKTSRQLTSSNWRWSRTNCLGQ